MRIVGSLTMKMISIGLSTFMKVNIIASRLFWKIQKMARKMSRHSIRYQSRFWQLKLVLRMRCQETQPWICYPWLLRTMPIPNNKESKMGRLLFQSSICKESHLSNIFLTIRPKKIQKWVIWTFLHLTQTVWRR